MTQPQWYSEPFPPTGGISAEGVRNQLGRPRLSLLEVLAREAIQNSWDARLNMAQVKFALDAWDCSVQMQRSIVRMLDAGLPIGLPLKDSLGRRPLRMLVVSDRGTTGLGGPTRADIGQLQANNHDFVAFIRNVGEPRDKAQGAGTFGFGKSIFYLASRARTIIVYTRCRVGRSLETRLIGCGAGNSFRMKSGALFRTYTGRHWWGVSRDGVQEPIVGKEADQIALQLGMPPYTGRETGTSIAVIDPVFDDPVQDMSALAWSILWHAWPKLVSGDMAFSLTWNGESITLPDPRHTPPLDAFVNAYQELSSGEDLDCHRPRQRLGKLALYRQIVHSPGPSYPSSFEPPIQSPVHHVALLRAPHLVVKYLAGESLPGDVVEYAGVFLADSEIDDVFADAEPPTHDDWVAKQLTGNSKAFVSTTFTRLSEHLRSYARPVSTPTWGTASIPLGAASSIFADLVATSPSTGAERAAANPSHPSSTKADSRNGAIESGRKPTQSERLGEIEEVGSPEYATFEGQPVLIFRFRVLRALDGGAVVAVPGIAVDETRTQESESPAGSMQPRLIAWLGPDDEVVKADALKTTGRLGQLWSAIVAPVFNTVTTLGLKLER